MPCGRTNGRGLGHVTPAIFGSMVGYPSDSLASCCFSFQPNVTMPAAYSSNGFHHHNSVSAQTNTVLFSAFHHAVGFHNDTALNQVTTWAHIIEMKSCTDASYKLADMRNVWALGLPYQTDAHHRRRVQQWSYHVCLAATLHLQTGQQKHISSGKYTCSHEMSSATIITCTGMNAQMIGFWQLMSYLKYVQSLINIQQ